MQRLAPAAHPQPEYAAAQPGPRPQPGPDRCADPGGDGAGQRLCRRRGGPAPHPLRGAGRSAGPGLCARRCRALRPAGTAPPRPCQPACRALAAAPALRTAVAAARASRRSGRRRSRRGQHPQLPAGGRAVGGRDRSAAAQAGRDGHGAGRPDGPARAQRTHRELGLCAQLAAKSGADRAVHLRRHTHRAGRLAARRHPLRAGWSAGRPGRRAAGLAASHARIEERSHTRTRTRSHTHTRRRRLSRRRRRRPRWPLPWHVSAVARGHAPTGPRPVVQRHRDGAAGGAADTAGARPGIAGAQGLHPPAPGADHRPAGSSRLGLPLHHRHRRRGARQPGARAQAAHAQARQAAHGAGGRA